MQRLRHAYEISLTGGWRAPSLMVRQSAAPGPARSAVARKSCPKPTRPMTSNDSHCSAPSMSIARSAPCSFSRCTSRPATSSTVPNPFLHYNSRVFGFTVFRVGIYTANQQCTCKSCAYSRTVWLVSTVLATADNDHALCLFLSS